MSLSPARHPRLYIFSIVVVILLLASPFLRREFEETLVDLTGETDPKQQVIAIYSPLVQRPAETADFTPVAYAGVNPYGANVFFEQEVEEWKLHKSMQMLREAGVKWVRQQIPWSDIELKAKGDYEGPYGNTWLKYDRFIEMANDYGLEMVARLDDPPNWTRIDNSVHNRPPDDFADYGDFVHAFVSRYKGKIKYIQIWNEPNVYPEWGNRAVDAQGYAELLKVGYTRAKEANPDIVVIAAGLAPTMGEEGGRSESDLTFFQKMYDAGAKDYFDIMGAMGYGLWTGPGDRRLEEDRVNFSRPQLIREIMVRNGDADKAVWISEVGWNALPDDFPKPPTHGKVSREQQARYAENAYGRATGEWPWAGVLFYWHFRMVHDENKDQVMFYFGMADPDFTTYPVYDTFGKMANEKPVINRGYHQENHYAVKYQGGWYGAVTDNSSGSMYRWTDTVGDTMTFTFNGTELDLVVKKGEDLGKFYVVIDRSNILPNMIPRDKQWRAYIDLADTKTKWQERIPVATGLKPGEHEVRLVAAEQGKRVAIDGIIVNSTNKYIPNMAFGIFLSVALGMFVLSSLKRLRKRA